MYGLRESHILIDIYFHIISKDSVLLWNHDILFRKIQKYNHNIIIHKHYISNRLSNPDTSIGPSKHITYVQISWMSPPFSRNFCLVERNGLLLSKSHLRSQLYLEFIQQLVSKLLLIIFLKLTISLLRPNQALLKGMVESIKTLSL